jgi:hypothetical protein
MDTNEIVIGACGICNSPDIYLSKKMSAMGIVEKCEKKKHLMRQAMQITPSKQNFILRVKLATCFG